MSRPKCERYFYLHKIFDTVNHNILISKLENYGIRGKNLLWFISYLTSQTQFIKYNNLSTSFKAQYLVPQGSILRPLLFLIYVNDLIHYVHYIHYLL